MNEATKEKIRTIIRGKIEPILQRKIKEWPQKKAELLEKNPFGSRLVPDEIWKSSAFERSFVTTFGQNVYEQVAREIALGSESCIESSIQYRKNIRINQFQDSKIYDILASQRSAASVKNPDWEKEISEIKSLSTRAHIDVESLFDLYVKRKDGTEEFYSLKTVQPNLDQIEITKANMMRMSVGNENARTYIALYYNPFGEGNLYTRTLGNKLFDWNNSSAVLIGSSFWNTVGQDSRTYEKFIEILNELSEEYINRIRDEYLSL